MSFIHGNDRLHGPHHDAQKSTYTTWPLSLSRVTVSPLAVGSAKAGAASPASTASAGEVEAINAANSRRRRSGITGPEVCNGRHMRPGDAHARGETLVCSHYANGILPEGQVPGGSTSEGGDSSAG